MLKYPSATWDHLLTLFGTFAGTEEHRSTVARCRNDASGEELAERHTRKAKLYRLRNIRRAAAKQCDAHTVPDHLRVDQHWMDRFTSGDLDREIEELTRQHGFGRVHLPDGTIRDVRPPTFEDYVSSRRSAAQPRAATPQRS